eukprot:g10383.t1
MSSTYWSYAGGVAVDMPAGAPTMHQAAGFIDGQQEPVLPMMTPLQQQLHLQQQYQFTHAAVNIWLVFINAGARILNEFYSSVASFTAINVSSFCFVATYAVFSLAQRSLGLRDAVFARFVLRGRPTRGGCLRLTGRWLYVDDHAVGS